MLSATSSQLFSYVYFVQVYNIHILENTISTVAQY